MVEPLDLPAESLSWAVNCSSSEKRNTIFIILPCRRVADFISLGFGYVSYFFYLVFYPSLPLLPNIHINRHVYTWIYL